MWRFCTVTPAPTMPSPPEITAERFESTREAMLTIFAVGSSCSLDHVLEKETFRIQRIRHKLRNLQNPVIQ